MKNNIARFFCLVFVSMIAFCHLLAQNTENRYVKKVFTDFVCYQYRLSHEKDKSKLLSRLSGWKLDVIANHMSDAMSKQQFHKQFVANLKKEFTKEELLKFSSFTGVLTFKTDVYNELYDIDFNVSENDVVLSDSDFDRIITCLESAINGIEFDLEYLQQYIEIEISMDNRPFIRYTWGGKGWKNLQ